MKKRVVSLIVCLCFAHMQAMRLEISLPPKPVDQDERSTAPIMRRMSSSARTPSLDELECFRVRRPVPPLPQGTNHQKLTEKGSGDKDKAGLHLVQMCRTADKRFKEFAGIVLIEMALENHPNLTMCDRQGSALMWLAFHGCESCFTFLLGKGASLTATSDLGYTPLHAAAQNGNLALVKMICERPEIDVNCAAACGSTALHLAAQGGHEDVIVYLLEKNANQHIRDSLGRTPLHLAVWDNHEGACSSLLMAGADCNTQMQGGFTPLQVGVYRNSEGALKALGCHDIQDAIFTKGNPFEGWAKRNVRIVALRKLLVQINAAREEREYQLLPLQRAE